MDKKLSNLKISNIDFTAATPRDTGSRGPKRPFPPTIVYVYPEGETIMANLANRRQRPNTTYKKLLNANLAALEIPPGTKLAWNQKAGCGCGCSPGFFVVDQHGYATTLFRQFEGGQTAAFTISVYVKEDAEQATQEPAPTPEV